MLRRALIRLALRALIATVAAVLALLLVLWAFPPALLRVGSGYTAKIVCSSVFLEGREAQAVLDEDVQAPGTFLLRLMRIAVDREGGVVRASFLGFIAPTVAAARPGQGCALFPDGKLDGVPHSGAMMSLPPSATRAAPWPDGEASDIDPAIERVIENAALAGPGARALLVVHRGRLVAEHYAPGFDAARRQLGWSMTKSVTAALIGLLVKDQRLALDRRAGFAPGDARGAIRIADLSSMTSGLHFNEGYGAVSDLTRMLFLEGDMAAFARAQPLEHPVGTVWSYSSGTAVILARLFQDAAGGDSLAFVRARLFEPLGMTSAVIETDAHGTLVGSSYGYATPRDWARYGLFLEQEGVWHGQEILPPGYVAWMRTPVAASHGHYGQGEVWLWGPDPQDDIANSDAAFGLPRDIFWMLGHDGQSIALIPSRELVIVRMGLTPQRLHYQPQPLVRAVLAALGGADAPKPSPNVQRER